MLLDELIDGLGLHVDSGEAGVAVRGLTDDSRQVQPGYLFVARRGVSAGGVSFVEEAVRRSAVGVVVPEDAKVSAPAHVCIVRCRPGVAVDGLLTGRLAERFYGDPSGRLKLIGVTGTNGKTTVAWIVRHLLKAAGLKAGLIGTIAVDDGSEDGARPAALTTPGPVQTAGLLATMVANGCEAAVMEVSSHALDQGRTAALHFHAAVFTNLTGDHLDYHGSMEAYAAAKARLFEQLPEKGWAIINADDPYAVTMFGAGRCRAQWTTLDPKLVGEAERRGDANSPQGFAYGKVLSAGPTGSRVVLAGNWGALELNLPLIGRHNVSNALQAVAVCSCVTDRSRYLRSALESCPQVPGRLERVVVDPAGPRPTVLVDYAHTHDALANVLGALRPLTGGRLTVVVGCGGDRDRTKRPKMARVARDLADAVWITSDNPRTEDPDAIIAEMVAGLSGEAMGPVTVQPDRAEAIAQAIAAAGPDDTVLIAGKGHEDYQILPDPGSDSGTRTIAFDDRAHAAEALRRWTDPSADARSLPGRTP